MPHSLIMDVSRSCAFTGHRILGKSFDLSMLKTAVETLISQGVENFYCGMAMGFDLIAAEVVLDAKKLHPHVKLIACVPCPDQQKSYPAKEKIKYERLLPLCDKVELLSDYYYRGCMLTRDRFMVDNCSRVLAYMARCDGGTAYTVRYAKSRNKQIYIM